MTVKHKNFFENLKEAHIRLRHTVVLYDGEPVYVLAITDHKKDGVFRVYCRPIEEAEKRMPGFPPIHDYNPAHEEIGPWLDNWMTNNPGHTLLRKQMSSPKFDRFRPFPLGMCNIHGKGTSYVARQPVRPRTEQGLVKAALHETPITAARTGIRAFSLNMFTQAFKDCILGRYPSAKDCIDNLRDPEVTNEAAAFAREFALVRGPIDMIFLAYKEDIVGALPKGDFSEVRLGKEFKHTKEAIEELQLFTTIN